MSLEGFIEYKAREFCNDVKCQVQMTLNTLKDKPEAYELIRQTCKTSCRYTTWQFHHWLIEKGYIILANLKLKNSERTVLINIDKELVEWIDSQVQKGNFSDRSQLIENAIAQYKKEKE
jgi:hypothetical protein